VQKQPFEPESLMRVRTACQRDFLEKMVFELGARGTKRVSRKRKDFVYCKLLLSENR